ncbi:MAG: serine/threonine-protein kinase [Cyanobacteria bacterium J06626_23]
MSVESLIGLELNQRYRLQSLLGSSPDRRTFLAIDLQATVEEPQQVVVKLFLFGLEASWEAYRLFEREAATLKSLNHAAIPHHLDAFDVETSLGKGFALVQTYVPLRSLRDWVEAGRRFTEADLVHIATELLAVLDYLHGMQPPVIHRDIKPSNLLISDRTAHSPGDVYLIDFGSVQTADHGGTRTVVGTYGYMPLEQFGGRAEPASDLYSLGATLIYLATGRHPADLPQKKLKIDFAAQASLSRGFARWLGELVEPEVQHRPESTAIALQNLQSLNKPAFKLLPAKNLVLNKFRLSSFWTVASPTASVPPRTLAASIKSVEVHQSDQQIEVDLPVNRLKSRHILVFNPSRDHLRHKNTRTMLAIYLLLIIFPLGSPLLWPQYRWLWVGISIVVLAKLANHYNYSQQQALLGYRLRLEELDGKKHLSLKGISAQGDIDSQISRADITEYRCGPGVEGYQLVFHFRNSKYRKASSYKAETDKRITLQLKQKEAKALRLILENWCGELAPRKL